MDWVLPIIINDCVIVLNWVWVTKWVLSYQLIHDSPYCHRYLEDRWDRCIRGPEMTVHALQSVLRVFHYSKNPSQMLYGILWRDAVHRRSRNGSAGFMENSIWPNSKIYWKRLASPPYPSRQAKKMNETFKKLWKDYK